MASKKRKCTFGDKCYRKNKDHLDNYEHPSKKKEEIDIEKENEKDTNEKIDKKMKLEKEIIENNDKNKDLFDINKIDDIKKLVLDENKMQMPDDFYDFLEFCKSINKKDPKNALKLIDIQLVGVYDLILECFKTDYKLYYRYMYDVPEFQTVLKGNEDSMLHFGYYRDDPNQLPDFVAINEAKNNCKIIPKGENLFSAVNWYIDDLLKNDEKNIDGLNDLKKQLTQWCEKSKHEWSLQLKTAKTKAREKKINCKTFHEAGICVPVDERGFGYRELPETYDSLKKIFINYCTSGDAQNIKAKKLKAEEAIQELMTLTQFANDESDYGMALELGQCMFSFGDKALNKYIKNLLSISYTLLNRNYYSEIIKAHLNNRLMKIDQ